MKGHGLSYLGSPSVANVGAHQAQAPRLQIVHSIMNYSYKKIGTVPFVRSHCLTMQIPKYF